MGPIRKLLRLLTLLVVCAQGLRAAEPAKTSTGSDREQLQGTWKIVAFHDDGNDKIGRLGVSAAKKGQPERIAKLAFAGDECYVLRADGKRDALAGLTNCAWKSYSLKAAEGVKQIDLQGVGGKEGEKLKLYPGIYELSGAKLRICWNEGGAVRPTKLESNGEMNLFECERLSSEPEQSKP